MGKKDTARDAWGKIIFMRNTVGTIQNAGIFKFQNALISLTRESILALRVALGKQRLLRHWVLMWIPVLIDGSIRTIGRVWFAVAKLRTIAVMLHLKKAKSMLVHLGNITYIMKHISVRIGPVLLLILFLK